MLRDDDDGHHATLVQERQSRPINLDGLMGGDAPAAAADVAANIWRPPAASRPTESSGRQARDDGRYARPPETRASRSS
jgi:hypothetical protein